MATMIILASNSAARQKMMLDAGVNFSVHAASVDENAQKAALLRDGMSGSNIADALASSKAVIVSKKLPDAYVIGSYEILDCEGVMFSKPATIAEARTQLTVLRGQKHSLFSAAVVAIGGQPVWRSVGQTDLWMRQFSDRFLDQYIANEGDALLQTVGCYRLESGGVRLFSRIRGDYFTVLGMPLVELLSYMAETGVLLK